MAGDVSVMREQVDRRVAGRDPIVDLAGTIGHPAGPVGRQLDAAHGGRVPQEPVPPARHHERHRDFGVALDKVDDQALLVETAMKVLTEPEELLVLVGAESAALSDSAHCRSGQTTSTRATRNEPFAPTGAHSRRRNAKS